MSVLEIHVCDVCETQNQGQPGWLTMQAINAPEEMGLVLYDVCSWECLERFVRSDDEKTDDDDSLSQETDNHTPPISRVTGTPVPPVDPPKAPLPGMTLAQALAMGLKPGFDPVLDRGRDG